LIISTSTSCNSSSSTFCSKPCTYHLLLVLDYLSSFSAASRATLTNKIKNDKQRQGGQALVPPSHTLGARRQTTRECTRQRSRILLMVAPSRDAMVTLSLPISKLTTTNPILLPHHDLHNTQAFSTTRILLMVFPPRVGDRHSWGLSSNHQALKNPILCTTTISTTLERFLHET